MYLFTRVRRSIVFSSPSSPFPLKRQIYCFIRYTFMVRNMTFAGNKPTQLLKPLHWPPVMLETALFGCCCIFLSAKKCHCIPKNLNKKSLTIANVHFKQTLGMEECSRPMPMLNLNKSFYHISNKTSSCTHVIGGHRRPDMKTRKKQHSLVLTQQGNHALPLSLTSLCVH